MIRQDFKEFGKLAEIRRGKEKTCSRDHSENRHENFQKYFLLLLMPSCEIPPCYCKWSQ